MVLMIATDFLVNSGAVIYAAQEHIIKTPDHLQIPEAYLGNEDLVDQWLSDHESEFRVWPSKGAAAQQAGDQTIRRNMQELVDMLISILTYFL
jgi:glutamate dehydrogenase (NAD(P)+)